VYFAEFDTRGLLRGDLAAQANWLQTMLNTGIYSVNECREVLNMNPIGPEGDQRYMQANLTTMEGIAATAASAGESEQPPAEPVPPGVVPAPEPPNPAPPAPTRSRRKKR
jgi:hypothetical protein